MDLSLTTEVARVVSDSKDTETLARPLLEILHRLTGLDTTYLTEVDEAKDEQRILYSEAFGGVEVPEGLVVEWSDTLCRRALTTNTRQTDNVPELWPDSQAAKVLGLQTYVSVPVTNTENVVLGTLCGASGKKMPQGADVMGVMELFARLIADQWKRDEALRSADERAREAEQKLSERATQLAESEHKLKSPLTVIKGWATILDEDSESLPEDKRSQAVSRIRVAADKLADQLDELLEEQRRAATSQALEVSAVSLHELLEQVRVELSGLSRSHELKVNAPEALTIESNESTLWHILSHLGENAVKYSPNGGVVTLGAHRTGDHVVISVADTGPGLPEGVDVFSPFVRGDTETKGSGLGLHIVQTLARSLKAQVSVHSEAGKGTTFYVTLPNSLCE